MNSAKKVASRTLFAGKFLRLEEVSYVDEKNRSRNWESAVRTGETPAAMIVPVIKPDNELVIIRQFRPPVGSYVWETPAGLVENNEAFETAAMRELYEETGFEGKITKVLPYSYSSSGLSGEKVAIVFAEIDGKRYPNGALPETHQEDSEHIEVFRMKLDLLKDHLMKAIQAGDAVDSKLLLYAEMICPK